MASNVYHFITQWRVEASVEDVYRLISNAADLPRWWPAVYLAVREVEPGGADGLGKIVSLHTRGWLPYTLRWQLRVAEAQFPKELALEASGDFTGTGRWSFKQVGRWADVCYDWQIRADKPLLRYLSFILKPFFAANHHWAMAQGEKSLRAELARRAAMSR